MSLFLKFLVAAVAAGTPLLFGTVGEILNEKVGHLNLGVEGMMALGACAGFMTAYLTDSLALALLGAGLAAVLSGIGSAKGTGRFSQARIMPPSTFRRSKLWRLPSFFTTTIGRLSTVS